MKVNYESHIKEFTSDLERTYTKWLEESCGGLESAYKKNSRRDLGDLRKSITHKIDGHTGIVGSPLENAIWEEYGTGIHAENGNGRKKPWTYQDRRGDFYTTKGKKGTKALRKACEEKKESIMQHLNSELKRLGK